MYTWQVRTYDPTVMTTEAKLKKPKQKSLHSQRYTAIAKEVNPDELYDVTSAIELLKKTAKTKFVETVDLSVKLGIDTKKGEQNVRGTTTLPHGTGKVKKVAVLAKGDAAKEAEKAGADTVGAEDLITKIQNGFKDFEIIIAHEELATQIGKIGKMLGPKTPNKRNGTVTADVASAVKEIKAATRVEYRADKGGVINMPIGKANFTDAQLNENFLAALSAIQKAKPAGAKGKYVVTITLSTTMGPGIHLEPTSTMKLVGAV